MKRGILTINSKRNNKLDNQQIKNRDMNTTKKWSLVAVLCGLLTATLLTACGGMRNEPNFKPDEPNGSEEKTRQFAEQSLIIKADKEIVVSYSVFGFYDLYINGEKQQGNTEIKSVTIGANIEEQINFKALSDPYNQVLNLSLKFDVSPKEKFERDPEYDNQPNPLKPIPTIVSFTWQEKVNGKLTREESKTVKLYDPLRDPNSKWTFSSKEYTTGDI